MNSFPRSTYSRSSAAPPVLPELPEGEAAGREPGQAASAGRARRATDSPELAARAQDISATRKRKAETEAQVEVEGVALSDRSVRPAQASSGEAGSATGEVGHIPPHAAAAAVADPAPVQAEPGVVPEAGAESAPESSQSGEEPLPSGSPGGGTTQAPMAAAAGPAVATAVTAHGSLHREVGDVMIPAQAVASAAAAADMVLRENFTWVEQDLGAVCAYRDGSSAGLFSQGFACCTAIVLANEDAIGLMHTSTRLPDLDEDIREAILSFRTLSEAPPQILLGSNFGCIRSSLEDGEVWDEQWHDSVLASHNRAQYVADNMARHYLALADLALAWGASVMNLPHGAISIDMDAVVRGDEPGNCEFHPYPRD